jgi:DNA polymerase-3 subunit epsilon
VPPAPGPARGSPATRERSAAIVPSVRNLTLSRPLVVLDTETTGRDCRRDRLVEIAAIKYDPGGGPRVCHLRVNPGVPIPAQATRIHGITDADVAGCPSFAAVSERLLRFVTDADFAGYNVAFDLQFLAAEFGRCGIDLPLGGRAVIDPMRIFHQREPRDLAAAVEFYCGRPHRDAHSALADAVAAAAVLDAQLARYDDLPRSPAELHRQLGRVDVAGKFRLQGGEVVFGFGKYAGRALDAVACDDPDYLAWMLDADFLPDAKALARAALSRARKSSG